MSYGDYEAALWEQHEEDSMDTSTDTPTAAVQTVYEFHRIPTVYAIRQISTGYFMPASSSRGQHRYSEDEPTAGCIPRLFSSKASARSALNRWLDGKWGNVTERYVSDSGFGYDYEQELQCQPVEGRDRKDMEIVPLEIREGKE